MLFDYSKQVRRFLRDREQHFLNEESVYSYVNRARREVAMRAQCIRRVPPISGPITQYNVTAAGTGYTNPTVVISAPDSPGGHRLNPAGAQATATAQFIGGQISGVQPTYGGDGYFQPTATISDPTGSGAVVVPVVTGINVLNPFQEEYRFSELPLGTFSGVDSVFAIRGVSSLFNNLRYSWIYKSFSEYQAFIRTYTRQYFYTPAVFTQLEQGAEGSILIYPLPAQLYQWEPDCLCIPEDLVDDRSPEAIPEPWTEAVPYMAASLCYAELQNFNAAKFYQDQYDGWVHRYSGHARIVRTPMIYARRY